MADFDDHLEINSYGSKNIFWEPGHTYMFCLRSTRSASVKSSIRICVFERGDRQIGDSHIDTEREIKR